MDVSQGVRMVEPMAVTAHAVRFGAEACERLEALVAAAKAHDRLAPVTVVVPTNAAGVALRRRLAAVVGGVGAITFVTVYRLAELLGAGALGLGRRPVTTPVAGAAVRAVLAEAPGAFASVAEHPATELALVAAHRELSSLWVASPSGSAGQEPPGLARLSREGRPLAREVVRVHRAVREALGGHWYDEADLLVSAREAVERGSPVVDELGTVVIFLPDELGPGPTRLVAALGQRTDVVVLAGFTGVPDADVSSERALARLGVSPERSERPAPRLATATDVEIVTATDADEEVRAAVRSVVAAIRAGTPMERIALLYAAPEPYARLVHEHLGAVKVPFNGAAVRPLRERVLGRFLLALLALPESGWRRREVLGLLACGLVRHHGRRVPVSAWARVSRAAGVVGGNDWAGRLARYAAERRELADRRDGDEGPGAGTRARVDADRAEQLAGFVADLQAQLEAAPASWSGLARWARHLSARLLGDEHHRQGWPPAERVAAAKVEAAVERLAGLDQIDPAPGLAAFRRTLELEFDADLGRVGRLGDGVQVGPIGSLAGTDIDVVVMTGLAEGTFPANRREDSLLTDADRVLLDGELPLAAEDLHRAHRRFLAAMASAGHRVLTTPRGDLRRTSARVPSRWLLDVAAQAQRSDHRLVSDELAGLAAPWLKHVASFADAVVSLAEPTTGQEYRLGAFAGAGPLTAHPGRVADPVLDRGVRLLTARQSARFSAYDGNLAGCAVPAPTDAATSATRLERWASCPFAYLMEFVFGARPVEDPETIFELSALDAGNLVHATLDRFVGDLISAGTMPRAADAWTDRHTESLRAVFGECCDDAEARGITGRDVYWQHRRAQLWGDLVTFLDHDARYRAARGATPVASELRFGLPGGDLDEVTVPLADGRSVRFRGSVDRIDHTAEGGLLVIDYKTGSTRDFGSLGVDRVANGRKLQLPVYALVARAWARANGIQASGPVDARYWFISAKGGFAVRGGPVDQDDERRFVRAVNRIVAGIEAGAFPAVPPDRDDKGGYVPCPACNPDGLGAADLRRAASRKAADPALAAWLTDLDEPDANVPGADDDAA